MGLRDRCKEADSNRDQAASQSMILSQAGHFPDAWFTCIQRVVIKIENMCEHLTERNINKW